MIEIRSCRPFIPSWLDDFGLTANEFRVYAHLSRRAGKDGMCYPAMPSIMEVCRISENTGWRVLKRLEDIGLIVRKKRNRNSNSYFLPPEPAIPITAKETAPKCESPQSNRGQSPQNERQQSPQSARCEGSPEKEIQKRASTLASNSAPDGAAIFKPHSGILTLDESVSYALELHKKRRYYSEELLAPFKPEEIVIWATTWYQKVEGDDWNWRGEKLQDPKANLKAWISGCAQNQSKRFNEFRDEDEDYEDEPPF